MIVHPRPGQRVQVWYRTAPRRRGGVVPADVMPHHGKIGSVRIVGKGPGPRNHGIEMDGALIGVPCGNLRLVPEGDQANSRGRARLCGG